MLALPSLQSLFQRGRCTSSFYLVADPRYSSCSRRITRGNRSASTGRLFSGYRASRLDPDAFERVELISADLKICGTSKFVLPQTGVRVLDRTVAWSGVSMRMCPPQCVTCKSVRVDEFEGFVGERARGSETFRSPIASCRDEWWGNVVHLSFEKCDKSNRARQHLSRFMRNNSRGCSPVFEKECKRSPGSDFEETVQTQYLIKKECTTKRSDKYFGGAPLTAR